VTGQPGSGEAQLRAEFRAFVREHHPDRGGDPDEFVAGLARFETRFAALRATAVGHGDDRYDAPIEIVTPYPLPLRVAIALIRTVRKQRNRVE
jgi:hypothetical protein